MTNQQLCAIGWKPFFQQQFPPDQSAAVMIAVCRPIMEARFSFSAKTASSVFPCNLPNPQVKSL